MLFFIQIVPKFENASISFFLNCIFIHISLSHFYFINTILPQSQLLHCGRYKMSSSTHIKHTTHGRDMGRLLVLSLTCVLYVSLSGSMQYRVILSRGISRFVSTSVSMMALSIIFQLKISSLAIIVDIQMLSKSLSNYYHLYIWYVSWLIMKPTY